jgi:hypothetical protein
MKLKSLLFALCVGVCSSVFADTQASLSHTDNNNQITASKNVMYPGYCEIEIINNSFDNIRVYGVLDDGAVLVPFNIYSFEPPYYIPLYYYGYCHAGMNLYIDTFSGYHVYAGYTERRKTIRVVPYLIKQVKAEISTK